jgi:DNA-binding PadR family transcriptional regulator
MSEIPGPSGRATERSSERRRPIRAGRGGSLLDLALLGVLAGGSVHGYEVKRQLDDVLPAGSGVSFGSLYPTLGRLERSGEVRGLDSESADVPPTGALTGELAAFRGRLRERTPGRRGRKVYAITDSGRSRLVELLTNLDPADDRTFALQVAFCRHLDRTQRLSVLARRRSEVAGRLDATVDSAAGSRSVVPGSDGPVVDDVGDDPWRRSLRDHTAQGLAAELAWVDALIDAEPDGGDRRPVMVADADDLAPTLGGHSRPLDTPRITPLTNVSVMNVSESRTGESQ